MGLTPTSRSDVSKLYESTNTVNENISSVTSLRDGGDSQLLGAGIAARFVSERNNKDCWCLEHCRVEVEWLASRPDANYFAE